jgi:ribonuclease R
VQGHHEGHGLLIPDAGGDALALSHRQMRACFHGDRVLVRRQDSVNRGRNEAKIVEVLERKTTQLVGRLQVDSGVAYVIPENRRITHDVLIADQKTADAQLGDIVTVQITTQPDLRRQPVGNITEVLGRAMAPGMEIDIALRTHGIPWEFSTANLEQLENLPERVSEDECVGRFDLRQQAFVTIDGADAKDFDDALCVHKRAQGGWKLAVAIADVSHYVQPNTPLDEDAQERATSVYFPERVIPMLPEALSNDLCSLNPAVDRLVMVCEMQIDAQGQIIDYAFFEAVIHSHARLTYDQFWQWMQGEPDAVRDQVVMDERKVEQSLTQLHALFKELLKARQARGAMEIETIEPRIVFGPGQKIEQILPYRRNDAHRVIEECMLAANVCAADLLERADIPALYRVHAPPPPEKLETLRQYLAELGLALMGGADPEPQDYQVLMQQVLTRDDRDSIQSMILRSLSQASYRPDNEGHFGLAYEAYTHFTSPIRRYPDLLVHRALRALLRSGRRLQGLRRSKDLPKADFARAYPYDAARIQAFGEHCSQCERRADEATRDVVAWLKCEFMQDRIGEVFQGRITAVVGFGLFVQLEECWVEGLIHVTSMPRDYYVFDAAHQRMVGERTRVVHRLGDEVQIRVVRVSLEERKIDFELIPDTQPRTLPPEGRPGRKPKPKSKPRAPRPARARR